MVTILFRYGLQAAPKMQTDILTLDKLGLVGNVNPIQASLQNIICKSLGPFLASMHLLHLVHHSISIAQFVLAKRSAGITLTTTGGIFIVCVCVSLAIGVNIKSDPVLTNFSFYHRFILLSQDLAQRFSQTKECNGSLRSSPRS